jgi:hypothetical protein
MAQPSTTEITGSPRASLMPLITGFMAARLVHIAAELGIADRLADGAKTGESLAAETETHAPSLHRLLRALASLGVLDETEPGRFALTPLGAQLRRDAPDSVRSLAMLFGSGPAWRCWGELRHCLRTGETAMRHLYGMGAFEYFAAHPEEATIFNAAMAENTRQVGRALVAAYDFSRLRSIVDVGGGNGTLMAAILAAAPALRGVVFDLPGVGAEAPRQLAAAGVATRCQVVAGDFFRSVPDGADAYILKHIIHDWDDEQSLAILRNCRDAIAASGRLLVVERVLPARVDAMPHHRQATMLDMLMLAVTGGRERTEAEYRALFAAAGFELARILPLAETDGFSLIEGTPA